MNGASPVRFVLSLFYLCTFQKNPVCVVCVVTSDWGLFLVCERSQIQMTGVCLFVSSGQDLTRRPPIL